MPVGDRSAVCGLLTLLVADGKASARVDVVRGALLAMSHRGPDERGMWCDADVVHGFHRLAVIDLKRSHQPMVWGPVQDPSRYVLAFNGEIYNYVELRAELAGEHGVSFATDGDTEVLAAALHYWRRAALPRLRGMFAFVLWDRRERVLVGARDGFGIKPLYWLAGPGGLGLASEKKSLLAVAPALGLSTGELGVDRVAVQDYLALQYVPEPASLHRAIRRVESGTMLTARPGRPVSEERWFVPAFHAGAGRGEQVHRRILAALRDSVAVHMRADVPVGTFLSGGIDSTAITALAREHNPNLIAFTAAFARPGYSEADQAAHSAADLGVRHVVRTVTAQEVADALPAIIWYLDDPVADPALVPLWFLAREARREVTVVLSGEGADELFGGYRVYHEPLSLAAFDHVPATLRTALGRASRLLPDGVRGKDLLRRGSLPLEQRYYGNARTFQAHHIAQVLRDYDPYRDHRAVTAAHYRDSAGWDPVARMQHLDLLTWLRGDILVKADKMTMAHSLELRVPFLDSAVFAVACGLPRDEKITGRITKHGLRQALRPIVPAQVLDRPKLGFPVPIRHWLRDELYGWARDVVSESQADHLVNLTAVQRLLDQHKSGNADHSRRIWALLVLLLWHGIFVEQRIHPVGPPRPAPRTPGRAA